MCISTSPRQSEECRRLFSVQLCAGRNQPRKPTTTAMSRRHSFVCMCCHFRGSLLAVFAGDGFCPASFVVYQLAVAVCGPIGSTLRCVVCCTLLHCTCQGEWASGKPHGQGTATHKDGEKYVGTYKAGLYHGEGEYYPLGTTSCRTRGTAFSSCRNILCGLFSLSLKLLVPNVGRLFASFCMVFAVSTLLLLYDIPSRTFLPCPLCPSCQKTPRKSCAIHTVLACFHRV